jgi:hypothetical protein
MAAGSIHMQRITIYIRDDAAQSLVEMADAERRRPRDTAAILLEQVLRDRRQGAPIREQEAVDAS